MAAVSNTNPYGALSLSVAVLGSGETETQLAAGAYIVLYSKGDQGSRKYNPWSLGFTPQTGDAASVWLPKVVSTTAINDPTGALQAGQYLVVLSPGTSDTVNAASVAPLRLNAGTVFVTASGTF
jgi:hypothetical protein